jgi:hypothetical protein
VSDTAPDPMLIAQRVRKILNENGQEMFVAALGNVLAKSFGRPLRELIGEQKLTDFIQDHLDGEVSLSGASNRLLANLLDPEPRQAVLEFSGVSEQAGSAQIEAETPKLRKYDGNFWAAFIKPIRRNQRRILDPKPPFDWRDSHIAPPEGWLEIEAALIPSADQPWPVRKKAAGLAINRWCLSHGLDPADFADKSSHNLSTQGQNRSVDGVNIDGAKKLLALVGALQASQRNQQYINCDLIYALLSAR